MFSSYYMDLLGYVSPNKMHESDVPVVAIFPEDREQVERLARAYKATWTGATSSESSVDIIVRQMQAALRSLVEPPKPPEPTGLGAVVEDAEGIRYVRTERYGGIARWVRSQAPEEIDPRYVWSAISAVRVLSEGVPS